MIYYLIAIALIATFIAGVILARKVLSAVDTLHRDFITDAEAVHARLTKIENAVKGKK